MAIRGLAEFEKQLKELEQTARGEVLKKALLSAVQPTVRKAASNAPVGKGGLSRSMIAQAMTNASAGEAIVRVGPGRPEGSHGILLEYGTVYMTKKPFLASAYEATFTEVEEIMQNELLEIFLENK